MRNYMLTVFKNYGESNFTIEKILSEIILKGKTAEYGELFEILDECGESEDSTWWEDKDKDLLKLSIDYPDVVFQLMVTPPFYYEAESASKTYYHNGEMQYCSVRITFDECEF